MPQWKISGHTVERKTLRKIVLAEEKGKILTTSPPIPDVLYKYVDEEHADIVQNGGLKFSEIEKFAELKNGREDDTENSTTLEPAHLDLDFREYKETRRNMHELGFGGLGRISIHAEPGSVRFRSVGSKCTVGCYSLSRSSKSLLNAPKKQAIFEILNVPHYFYRIMKLADIRSMIVGPMIYEARNFTSFDEIGYKSADPFRKPYGRPSDGYSFENEQEYRVLFNDIPLKNFRCSSDKILTRFIKRLK